MFQGGQGVFFGGGSGRDYGDGGEGLPVRGRIEGGVQVGGGAEGDAGALVVSALMQQHGEFVLGVGVGGVQGEAAAQHLDGLACPAHRAGEEEGVAVEGIRVGLFVFGRPPQVGGRVEVVFGEMIGQQGPEAVVEVRVERFVVGELFPVVAGVLVGAGGQVQFAVEVKGVRVVGVFGQQGLSFAAGCSGVLGGGGQQQGVMVVEFVVVRQGIAAGVEQLHGGGRVTFVVHAPGALDPDIGLLFGAYLAGGWGADGKCFSGILFGRFRDGRRIGHRVGVWGEYGRFLALLLENVGRHLRLRRIVVLGVVFRVSRRGAEHLQAGDARKVHRRGVLEGFELLPEAGPLGEDEQLVVVVCGELGLGERPTVFDQVEQLFHLNARFPDLTLVLYESFPGPEVVVRPAQLDVAVLPVVDVVHHVTLVA